MPGQLILIISYSASVFDDRWQTVMSMLPIVSTMIMPGRMAEGYVPAWQIGVAIGVTLLAAVLFVRVGSRLYERTLLRTGGRIGYRDAFKLGAGARRGRTGGRGTRPISGAGDVGRRK